MGTRLLRIHFDASHKQIDAAVAKFNDSAEPLMGIATR